MNRNVDHGQLMERERQEEILAARFSLDDPSEPIDEGSLDKDFEIITDSETPSEPRATKDKRLDP